MTESTYNRFQNKISFISQIWYTGNTIRLIILSSLNFYVIVSNIQLNLNSCVFIFIFVEYSVVRNIMSSLKWKMVSVLQETCSWKRTILLIKTDLQEHTKFEFDMKKNHVFNLNLEKCIALLMYGLNLLSFLAHMSFLDKTASIVHQ